LYELLTKKIVFSDYDERAFRAVIKVIKEQSGPGDIRTIILKVFWLILAVSILIINK